VTTTLLAVDDSQTIRKVLEITFAGEDYTTILATNSQEALSALADGAPAVALVDAKLGGESGYDLCQQIKSAAPGTAVIVLSSKQQPFDRERGNAAGADDFMDKPFDTQQLLDKVAAVAKLASEGGLKAPTVASAPAPTPAAEPPAPVAQEIPRSPTLSYGSAAPPAPASAAPWSAAPRSAPPPVATLEPIAPAAPAAHVAPMAAAAVAVATNGALRGRLESLGLSSEQLDAVLALSREIVEQVVWEVVPTLAETMIKEEIQRLTSD
jgi:CheY-like chemotaxis protein